MASFEADLVGHRVGWRQLVSLLAAAGLVVAVGGAALQTASGRWGAATTDLNSDLTPLMAPARPGFRVLWVGDPRALPLDGWARADGTAYALALNGPGDLTEGWPPPDPGPAAAVDADLALAESGRTVELGRLLAAVGVRYLVAPVRPLPSAQPSPDLSPPPALLRCLAQQLDLRPLTVDPSLVVYENAAWRSSDRIHRSPEGPGWRRLLAVAAGGTGWVVAGAILIVTRRRGGPDDPQGQFGEGSPEPAVAEVAS
jgi:hypothetical protein